MESSAPLTNGDLESPNASPSNNNGEKKEDNILGPSLLDVMQMTGLSSLKATFYSRSSVVARLHESIAGQDCTKRIQEYFSTILQKLQCDASGLVLIQDSSLCMIIECSSDHFTDLCAEFKSIPILVDVRIVATCDDNSTRLMQSLYFKKLSISKPVDESDEGQVVREVFTNLITLLRRLGATPSANIKKSIANPSNSDLMLMPSNETLLFLSRCELLMTLDEYLEIYKAPISVELESERVWPIHPLFMY